MPRRAGPLDTAILFVDLVSSSNFGSVLDLKEYADFVGSFSRLCQEQCSYYFDRYLGDRYRRGRDFDFEVTGDELVAFMHSGNPGNDIYQLICLAITLKCAWLGSAMNTRRLRDDMPTAELAAGVHFGKVYARPGKDDSLNRCGFAINVAKRAESASREGGRFQIFATDPAFKQINRRLRNLIFGRRQILPLKGVVVPVGVHELTDCFVNLRQRLAPPLLRRFRRTARHALYSNSSDLWIQSCHQVLEESIRGRVSREAFRLCQQSLGVDPLHASSLYHAALGSRLQRDHETALLYLQDLVRHFPHFADGWLEWCRQLKIAGRNAEARQALLQARRHGVSPEEESLPDPGRL